MANVNYTKDEVNNGIEGGLRYLRDFNMLDEYGKDTEDEGTIKGLMNDIEEAVNHYVSVTPKEKVINNSFNDQTEPGFWKVSITSSSTDGPYSITDTSPGFFWVINYSELTIIQLLIPTRNTDHYGKWLYRRGHRDNTSTSYDWSKWRYPLMDTENEVGQLQEIWSGISSQTGFRLKGHNADGAYDYDLALKSESSCYGLKDNNNKWILYKPKDSDNFIYDGKLKDKLSIEWGGTGATNADEARINLNVVNKSGDTMSGGLKVEQDVSSSGNFGFTTIAKKNGEEIARISLINGSQAENGSKNIGGLYSGTKSKWLVYLDKDGNGHLEGNATTASQLKTSRALKVNLGSESAISFDGSQDATGIGVAGILPKSHGGTGVSGFSKLIKALDFDHYYIDTKEMLENNPEGLKTAQYKINNNLKYYIHYDSLYHDTENNKLFLQPKLGLNSNNEVIWYITKDTQISSYTSCLGFTQLVISLHIHLNNAITAGTSIKIFEWEDPKYKFFMDPLYTVPLPNYSKSPSKPIIDSYIVPAAIDNDFKGGIYLYFRTDLAANTSTDVYYGIRIAGVYMNQKTYLQPWYEGIS